MAPRQILCLLAKAPQPGRVKTRLVPPLSAAQAAELYQAMLLDIADQSLVAGVQRALWYSPASARSWFEAALPAGYRLCLQRGADLGARLAEVFRVHAAEGYQRIVVRGTDSPSLPERRVAEAFEALERVDVVLCPDRDGGFNLVGLRGPAGSLFELEMSRADVLRRTLARARALGWTSECLASHHDVDTAADLQRLRLAQLDGWAPRTAAWLRRASP